VKKEILKHEAEIELISLREEEKKLEGQIEESARELKQAEEGKRDNLQKHKQTLDKHQKSLKAVQGEKLKHETKMGLRGEPAENKVGHASSTKKAGSSRIRGTR